MAINNYADLQASIVDWMARSDVTGKATDFITLAEARLNRILDYVAVEVTLTGVSGSYDLDVSALEIEKPVSLYVKDNLTEYEVIPRALGTFAVSDVSGLPGIYAFKAGALTFDRPLDHPYDFRLAYEGKLHLSDTAPTNELLTNSPDIYLAACIVWGGLYTKDDATLQQWAGLLSGFEAEVRHENAKKKRSNLTADPALARIGVSSRYWGRR